MTAPPSERRPARSPSPAEPRSKTGSPGWIVALIWTSLGAFLTLAVVAASGARIGGAPPPAAAPAPIASPAPLKLTARGQVRPVGQAKIGTLSGGSVFRLYAQVGDVVEEQQEIARVRGADGLEVITAPWRGTITAVPAHVGDTVTPGATLAYLGDLSRLQVETTDVDEFIIAQVRPGQVVRLTVDAIEGRTYRGRVRTVNLLPELNSSGDEHYPVVIDVDGSTQDFRLGMTVRVNFAPE